MTTLTMEEPSLVTDYQPEDDLEELWLELARDLIDHARITREWLVREAREFEAGHSPGTRPPPRDDMRHPPREQEPVVEVETRRRPVRALSRKPLEAWMRVLLIGAVALALLGGAAMADPWKDESGKGKWRGGYERHGGYGYSGGWDGPRERKVKMRSADGCEVKRKWKKGEYEEKVKYAPEHYRW